MKFKKHIGEWEIIPRFYGVAYRRPDMAKSICYPIPINFLVKWFLALILPINSYLKHGGRIGFADRIISEVYKKAKENPFNLDFNPESETVDKGNYIKCSICGHSQYSLPEIVIHPAYNYRYMKCGGCGGDLLVDFVIERVNAFYGEKGNALPS